MLCALVLQEERALFGPKLLQISAKWKDKGSVNDRHHQTSCKKVLSPKLRGNIALTLIEMLQLRYLKFKVNTIYAKGKEIHVYTIYN
jgi:hypothetical protein